MIWTFLNVERAAAVLLSKYSSLCHRFIISTHKSCLTIFYSVKLSKSDYICMYVKAKILSI